MMDGVIYAGTGGLYVHNERVKVAHGLVLGIDPKCSKKAVEEYPFCSKRSEKGSVDRCVTFRTNNKSSSLATESTRGREERQRQRQRYESGAL